MKSNAFAVFFSYTGRLLLVLAFLALVGAWTTQLTGDRLMGMSQQHLFNDAMSLALLGIGALVDGLTRAKNL